MNDFTREELLFIRCVIIEFFNRNRYHKLGDMALNKTQSMIDNYCEHDWDIKIYNKQPGNFKCIKCGMFLND